MALPPDFATRVIAVLRSTRPGEVVSYGELAADAGFPRQARAVGRVLALAEDVDLPWWRVVRADGSLPPSHEENARPHYLDEGTPLRSTGAVDMRAAFWDPETRE